MMKRLLLIILLLLVVTSISFAAGDVKQDTTKKADNSKIFAAVEVEPQFPGGIPAFGKFITKNLKYPEVASLVGLSGKVYISFVVDKDGNVVDARPVKCLGAGCESEAVRVVSMSPAWKPGIQLGKAVRVQYSVPISFAANRDIVYLKNLRRSNYGFVFMIDGKLLTIDEAEQKIGKSYLSGQLEEADPFYNADKDPKFDMPGKKDIYLLKIQSQ